MTYDLTRMLEQMHEDIEGSAADLNRLTVSFQLSSRFDNAVRSKRNYPISDAISHGREALINAFTHAEARQVSWPKLVALITTFLSLLARRTRRRWIDFQLIVPPGLG